MIGRSGRRVLLFLIAAGFALYHLARTGDFRRYLIAAIEQQTGLKAALGDAELDIGGILGVSFGNLAMTESDLAAPALSAERIA